MRYVRHKPNEKKCVIEILEPQDDRAGASARRTMSEPQLSDRRARRDRRNLVRAFCTPASCAVVGLAVGMLLVCVLCCIVFVLWCVVCCVCSILRNKRGLLFK